MKLSEVKGIVSELQNLAFQLPDGSMVPAHFHVTEIGQVTKKFIDCGGVVRTENKINFQLWQDERDIDHSLKPSKLVDIISLSERVLGLDDAEVEVEYQHDTIGRYDLEFDGEKFLLVNTYTDCLAKGKCGVPTDDISNNQKDQPVTQNSCCTPGGGCC